MGFSYGEICSVFAHYIVTLPSGWGLQQTTLAPGSNKTWGQGSLKNFKKEEGTVLDIPVAQLADVAQLARASSNS